MSEFFDYDPDTGIAQYFDYDEESGNAVIHSVQDIQPFLDHTKSLRNDEGLSKKGIKEDWWLYAKIPPIVIMQLRKKGIDVFNKDHESRVFKEINENYPYLKCTVGRHAVKHG